MAEQLPLFFRRVGDPADLTRLAFTSLAIALHRS
jgi:hypothetical protein